MKRSVNQWVVGEWNCHQPVLSLFLYNILSFSGVSLSIGIIMRLIRKCAEVDLESGSRQCCQYTNPAHLGNTVGLLFFKITIIAIIMIIIVIPKDHRRLFNFVFIIIFPQTQNIFSFFKKLFLLFSKIKWIFLKILLLFVLRQCPGLLYIFWLPKHK